VGRAFRSGLLLIVISVRPYNRASAGSGSTYRPMISREGIRSHRPGKPVCNYIRCSTSHLEMIYRDGGEWEKWLKHSWTLRKKHISGNRNIEAKWAGPFGQACWRWYYLYDVIIGLDRALGQHIDQWFHVKGIAATGLGNLLGIA